MREESLIICRSHAAVVLAASLFLLCCASHFLAAAPADAHHALAISTPVFHLLHKKSCLGTAVGLTQLVVVYIRSLIFVVGILHKNFNKCLITLINAYRPC